MNDNAMTEDGDQFEMLNDILKKQMDEDSVDLEKLTK